MVVSPEQLLAQVKPPQKEWYELGMSPATQAQNVEIKLNLISAILRDQLNILNIADLITQLTQEITANISSPNPVATAHLEQQVSALLTAAVAKIKRKGKQIKQTAVSGLFVNLDKLAEIKDFINNCSNSSLQANLSHELGLLNSISGLDDVDALNQSNQSISDFYALIKDISENVGKILKYQEFLANFSANHPLNQYNESAIKKILQQTRVDKLPDVLQALQAQASSIEAAETDSKNINTPIGTLIFVKNALQKHFIKDVLSEISVADRTAFTELQQKTEKLLEENLNTMTTQEAIALRTEYAALDVKLKTEIDNYYKNKIAEQEVSLNNLSGLFGPLASVDSQFVADRQAELTALKTQSFFLPAARQNYQITALKIENLKKDLVAKHIPVAEAYLQTNKKEAYDTVSQNKPRNIATATSEQLFAYYHQIKAQIEKFQIAKEQEALIASLAVVASHIALLRSEAPAIKKDIQTKVGVNLDADVRRQVMTVQDLQVLKIRAVDLAAIATAVKDRGLFYLRQTQAGLYIKEQQAKIKAVDDKEARTFVAEALTKRLEPHLKDDGKVKPFETLGAVDVLETSAAYDAVINGLQSFDLLLADTHILKLKAAVDVAVASATPPDPDLTALQSKLEQLIKLPDKQDSVKQLIVNVYEQQVVIAGEEEAAPFQKSILNFLTGLTLKKTAWEAVLSGQAFSVLNLGQLQQLEKFVKTKETTFLAGINSQELQTRIAENKARIAAPQFIETMTKFWSNIDNDNLQTAVEFFGFLHHKTATAPKIVAAQTFASLEAVALAETDADKQKVLYVKLLNEVTAHMLTLDNFLFSDQAKQAREDARENYKQEEDSLLKVRQGKAVEYQTEKTRLEQALNDAYALANDPNISAQDKKFHLKDHRKALNDLAILEAKHSGDYTALTGWQKLQSLRKRNRTPVVDTTGLATAKQKCKDLGIMDAHGNLVEETEIELATVSREYALQEIKDMAAKEKDRGKALDIYLNYILALEKEMAKDKNNTALEEKLAVVKFVYQTELNNFIKFIGEDIPIEQKITQEKKRLAFFRQRYVAVNSELERYEASTVGLLTGLIRSRLTSKLKQDLQAKKSRYLEDYQLARQEYNKMQVEEVLAEQSALIESLLKQRLSDIKEAKGKTWFNKLLSFPYEIFDKTSLKYKTVPGIITAVFGLGVIKAIGPRLQYLGQAASIMTGPLAGYVGYKIGRRLFGISQSRLYKEIDIDDIAGPKGREVQGMSAAEMLRKMNTLSALAYINGETVQDVPSFKKLQNNLFLKLQTEKTAGLEEKTASLETEQERKEKCQQAIAQFNKEMTQDLQQTLDSFKNREVAARLTGVVAAIAGSAAAFFSVGTHLGLDALLRKLKLFV